MRRITLVLALAVVMAAMVVLTVGFALAKDSQHEQTYVDTVRAERYFALPGVAKKFKKGARRSYIHAEFIAAC